MISTYKLGSKLGKAIRESGLKIPCAHKLDANNRCLHCHKFFNRNGIVRLQEKG